SRIILLISSALIFIMSIVLVFFFQAEDGIRVFHVTGVQTCALPIYALSQAGCFMHDHPGWDVGPAVGREGQRENVHFVARLGQRSEERRVGKACRSRLSSYQS